MRHAVGRSVGRVELKTKGGEREDLPLGIKGRGVSGAGPTWITWRQRLIRGTETIIQERVEIFSLFYLFFCPGVKFSPSCCFNRRHTEQHELPSCLFSISGVTNCLGKKNKHKKSFECSLYLPHLVSCLAEVPRLRSSGDLMHSRCHTGSKQSKQISADFWFHPRRHLTSTWSSLWISHS